MEKLSISKSSQSANQNIPANENSKINNLDLLSAEDTLRKIHKSPELSELPISSEKSASRHDTNSMNNTANNKFYTTKNEINNDSALSSFHIHNINNNKEKYKIPNNIKEQTIKIPKRESNKSNISNSNKNLSRESNLSNPENSYKKNYEKESLQNSYVDHKDKNFSLKNDEPVYPVNSKKIQINSLSLSLSKDKENENESLYDNNRFVDDNNYADDKFNINKSENQYKNINDIKAKTSKKEFRKDQNNSNDIYENNNKNSNDFSKSGTFKSHSADDNYDNYNSELYKKERIEANNTPDYYNYNENNYGNDYSNYEYKKSTYDVNNDKNGYTASNYSNSNFYKDETKKFSETLSDRQSVENEIRNYNNEESNITDRKNRGEIENKTQLNLNTNNSNINDMIKGDLYEYLSNLENKELIKLDMNKNNEWVVKFKKDNSLTNDVGGKDRFGSSMKKKNEEKKLENTIRNNNNKSRINDSSKNKTFNQNSYYLNYNSKTFSQSSTIKRNNSVNFDKKITEQYIIL
jgi:hypothetical protein